jgi:hypothetical protein
MTIYRQGDVLIQRIPGNKLPPKYKAVEPDKNKGVVLAYGEVTGHAHVLPVAKCTLYAWEGDRLLHIKEAAALTHEEHAPIPLIPGVYRVIQQREYHEEAPRNVAD